MSEDTFEMSPWSAAIALGIAPIVGFAYLAMKHRDKPTWLVDLGTAEDAAKVFGSVDPANPPPLRELEGTAATILNRWAHEGYVAYWRRASTGMDHPKKLHVNRDVVSYSIWLAFVSGWELAELHDVLGDGPQWSDRPLVSDLLSVAHTNRKLVKERKEAQAERDKLRTERDKMRSERDALQAQLDQIRAAAGVPKQEKKPAPSTGSFPGWGSDAFVPPIPTAKPTATEAVDEPSPASGPEPKEAK